MSFKLNLGSGPKLLKGYINVDFQKFNGNICFDLTKRLPLPDNFVDEIYAKHLIEHFTRLEWTRIIKDWHRVLKHSSLLVIECPDIDRFMKRFLDNSEGRKWTYWIMGIYGPQELYGPGQLHKNGFNLEKLTFELKSQGFNITKHFWLYDDTPDPNGFNLHLEAQKP